MPNNSKPNIRFKGFDQEWEEKRLDEMGDTYTGLSGKSKDDFGHGDGRYITYMNVFTNPIASPDEVGQIEIDNSQNQVKKGDILFTTSSETPDEVGMSSVWLEDKPNTYLNSFCFGYRPNVEIDPYFSAFLMRSPKVRENFYRLAQGISRFNISKQKAMEMGVEIPDPAEQQKIGSFFKALDELIAAKEEELEKLRQLKAALLEQMFPQSDADTTNRGGYNYLIDNYLQKSNMVISTAPDTPRIRFKGFTEPWEKSQLKKEVDYTSTGVRACDISSNGKYDLYDANDIIGKVNTYASDKPYISIIKDGAGVGRVRLLPESTNVLGTMGVISPKGENDINFIFSHIQNKDFKQHIISGAIPHVYFKNYGEDEILIPLPDEQQLIGNFFRDQDEVICASADNITKLKTIKQALLQKMFAA